MKRIVYAILFIFCIFPSILNGAGIYQNQNQSAEFIRTGNRNASTDVDSVYFNPAATAFLDDGIYLYFSNQYINDRREVKNTSKAIQTFVATPDNQSYVGEASTFVYPDIYLVVKKDDIALFAGASIVGAGASATFEEGLSMLDTLALGYVAALEGGHHTIAAYNADVYMDGFQAMMGVTIGGSYKINDMVSAALGVRFVYFMQSALVKLQWKTLDIFELGVPVSRLNDQVNYHDMYIDMDSTGSAWSFIVGTHVKPMKNMDIGFKFEYHTVLRTVNDTKIMHVPAALWDMDDVRIGMEGYKDGATANKTMPPVMTMGISYLFFEKLRVEADFTLFLNRLTQWGTDGYGQKIADKFENGYDVGFCLEYALLDDLKISSGFSYSVSGRTEQSTTDADIGNDAISLSAGATYAISENLLLTLAGMRVIFRDTAYPNDLSKVPEPDTKNTKDWLRGDIIVSERTWIAAFGVTYKIPFDQTAADRREDGAATINLP